LFPNWNQFGWWPLKATLQFINSGEVMKLWKESCIALWKVNIVKGTWKSNAA